MLPSQSSAFSAALFGAGLKTGQAIGTTDEFGRRPVAQPVSVPDLHATILKAMGVAPDQLLFHNDRPIPVTDHGQPIARLFS